MTPLERRVQALEGLIARSERERRQYFAVPIITATRFPTKVTIGGGNDIVTLGSTTYKGIKTAAPLASVPTGTPVAGTTYADGIGYGTRSDGVLVWILNAQVTGIGGLSFSNIVAGTPIAVLQNIGVGGVGNAPAYQIWRIA